MTKCWNSEVNSWLMFIYKFNNFSFYLKKKNLQLIYIFYTACIVFIFLNTVVKNYSSLKPKTKRNIFLSNFLVEVIFLGSHIKINLFLKTEVTRARLQSTIKFFFKKNPNPKELKNSSLTPLSVPFLNIQTPIHP